MVSGGDICDLSADGTWHFIEVCPTFSGLFFCFVIWAVVRMELRTWTVTNERHLKPTTQSKNRFPDEEKKTSVSIYITIFSITFGWLPKICKGMLRQASDGHYFLIGQLMTLPWESPKEENDLNSRNFLLFHTTLVVLFSFYGAHQMDFHIIKNINDHLSTNRRQHRTSAIEFFNISVYPRFVIFTFSLCYLRGTYYRRGGDYWSRRSTITAMELPQLHRKAHCLHIHNLPFAYFLICCHPFCKCCCVLKHGVMCSCVWPCCVACWCVKWRNDMCCSMIMCDVVRCCCLSMLNSALKREAWREENSPPHRGRQHIPVLEGFDKVRRCVQRTWTWSAETGRHRLHWRSSYSPPRAGPIASVHMTCLFVEEALSTQEHQEATHQRHTKKASYRRIHEARRFLTWKRVVVSGGLMVEATEMVAVSARCCVRRHPVTASSSYRRRSMLRRQTACRCARSLSPLTPTPIPTPIFVEINLNFVLLISHFW